MKIVSNSAFISFGCNGGTKPSFSGLTFCNALKAQDSFSLQAKNDEGGDKGTKGSVGGGG